MGRATRARFERAYHATTYRLIAGNTCLDLRIGARAPALDRLLHSYGMRHWAFVTACNPASRALPAWRNRARQARLWRSLAGVRLRLRLRGIGVPDASGWRPEPSVFVAPVSPGRARRIARRFGQNAAVAGRRGATPVLVWSD